MRAKLHSAQAYRRDLLKYWANLQKLCRNCLIFGLAENKEKTMGFIKNVFGSINPPLPQFKTLDEGIDYVLDYVGIYSEELSNSDMFIGTRWTEIRDNVHFHEALIHVFKNDGVYHRILDGDISTGSWGLDLGGFILKFGGHELYELVFLNENFFILKKHGKRSGKQQQGYLVFVKESVAKRREWTEVLEILYKLYQTDGNYLLIIFLVLSLIGLVMFFSLS